MKSFSMLFLVLATAACGNNSHFDKNSSSTDSFVSDPDPGVVNQAPKLSCLMTIRQRPTLTRRIDSISSVDTFFSENPRENETIDVDCTATTDESPLNSLQFAMDDNYQPAAPQFRNVSPRFSLPLSAPGIFPMAIKVSDPEDATTLKTFTLVVQCSNQIIPTLNLTGVRVTPENRLNYFRYAVDPSSLGGGSSFSFAWDFNGDGVFDPPSASDPNEIWTNQNSVSGIYTIFESTSPNLRKIGVRVRNQCNYEKTFQVALAQPIPNIDRTAAAEAVPKPYYYLQSNIRHSANSGNQRLNGDEITTWYPGDSNQRVKCDYKYLRTGQKAVFSISGINQYKEKQNTAFNHGMEIGIGSIPDTGATGLQVYNYSQGVRVSTARYLASAGDDGTPQEIFDRIQGGCAITFRIERAQAVAPCAPDLRNRADFKETAALILRGEYNCDNILQSSGSRSIASKAGKFFCEVAPVNQCVGGGGGGGNPPPEQ